MLSLVCRIVPDFCKSCHKCSHYSSVCVHVSMDVCMHVRAACVLESESEYQVYKSECEHWVCECECKCASVSVNLSMN